MSDSVKVDIDVDFDEPRRHNLPERDIIYNLLNNFSAVGDMTVSCKTLKLIYSIQHMNPLPKFRDLTRMRATMFLNTSLEVLPMVLESCPNMKRLTLELVNDDHPEAVVTKLSTVLSFCLVSSLESVEMESPITEKATEKKLVRYFLDNATSLKKLVLRLNLSHGEKQEPSLYKNLFDSSRRSRVCQFEVTTVHGSYSKTMTKLAGRLQAYIVRDRHSWQLCFGAKWLYI
ncbi:FBD domain [Arabidopsis suecica]|uniref:FBD domain n=1 Tax=Arabidopsis suecica TaxID=45249 RepID=A0A8T1ZET8_ARASU|nr:FBD domain [Arabidopsis suecica]